MNRTVLDVPFDDALDVATIRYRIAPLDVGFDVRAHNMPSTIERGDDPIRVSYAARNGQRRVISGPQDAVLRSLRGHGYRFVIADREGD